MSQNLKAQMIIETISQGIEGKFAEILIKQNQKEGIKLDSRIVILGERNIGKSTLIGILISGELDNGEGMARMRVLNHKHEFLSGQTSSISHNILGFDSDGNIINNQILCNSWENIVNMSTKIITLIDGGGSEIFKKTATRSLCSQFPDYACIILKATDEILPDSTYQHLKYAFGLKLPTFLVITHIECENENSADLIKQMMQLTDNSHTFIIIRNQNEVVEICKSILQDTVIPVLLVSNVTGQGLDIIKNFLSQLPNINEYKDNIHMNTEFYIERKYDIEEKIIIGGTVIKGYIRKNQTLKIGPQEDGQFSEAEVLSIQCKKVDVLSSQAGQNCTIEIQFLNESKIKKFNIRKGMVLIQSMNPKSTMEFGVELELFDKSEKFINLTYEPIINTQTIRQTCVIVNKGIKIITMNEELRKDSKKKRNCGNLKSIDSLDLGTPSVHETFQQILQLEMNKMNYIRFKFKYQPEYLTVGQKLIIDDALIKGIGWVKDIFQ